MSYVVTIRRQTGAPISRAEAQQVLAGDSELRTAGADRWQWQPTGAPQPLRLNWEADGALSTGGDRAWASNEGLAKLRLIAARLDATVVEEEGEDLSAHSHPSRPVSSAARQGDP